ncbi:ATPase component of ABC-type sugar transporter [Xenococcus sp. PCC 7305]|uniref:ABC transporter ATP-binding protein n=1 Tax=Xenococcus sp. PCC 7305 TaxID=102125 RepID=UPI0002AC0F97|nr:sn-glycerol-3-phosphate ABC transporter ATP-binding protein UgpC [Xenococcus sp. PCC 7305]ELS03559.1 ATPase component of ABC-type sugar transporter [Xenococcus sp. PCC 7305]
MAKVSLQGITRKFDNVTAIENITFTVEDHEFLVLVGPSGCGKSTILRAIAGLESITSGELYIGDRLVNDIPARQRDIAMVFQNYALYPHMSVAENLAFGLKMRGEKSTQINRRVQEVAHSLNIEHLLKRKPKQLSGGQQQRVALGRAIARQPQVFLLDEPLSNLDAQLRDDTRAELKQLHDRFRITTIYVTHDQVEAMTLADRIVVLQDGVIQQIATPQEIYAHPANRMVASFLGSPPMNIFPVIYRDGNFIINHQFIPISDAVRRRLQLPQGASLELGIRPENITIITNTEITEDIVTLAVEIDLVEPLGKEILIRGKFPDSHISINLFAPANWQGQKGDRLTIKLDEQQFFLFDHNGRVIAD